MLKNFTNPDLYHGWNKKYDFFEGWYFKFVDKNVQQAFAFIPGIHLCKTNKDSHCFIQILLGKEVKYRYLRFSPGEFVTSKNNFYVSIKGSLAKQYWKMGVGPGR